MRPRCPGSGRFTTETPASYGRVECPACGRMVGVVSGSKLRAHTVAESRQPELFEVER